MPQLRHVVGDVRALVVDEASESPELLGTVAGALILRIGPDLLGAYEEPVPCGRPDDIATVVFTSGSTGVPKGVAFSYRALSEARVWQAPVPGSAHERLGAGFGRFLLFGTLTSAVMLEQLALCLFAGGTAVIPAELPDFPWVLPRLKVTAALMTVPRLHQVLDVLRAEDVDLSDLRTLIVAGSPVPPHKLAEAAELIGPAMHHAYGQTETGMLTVSRAAEGPGSVGKACDTVEIEVRDPAGTPVPAGTEGEIWVRTPSAFAGYWRDEATTAEVLQDGWVRTQDLGHLDAAGYLHLSGRARDVVIVNAIIHYTGPIEQAIAAHPDVDQAYVVAVPDAADRRGRGRLPGAGSGALTGPGRGAQGGGGRAGGGRGAGALQRRFVGARRAVREAGQGGAAGVRRGLEVGAHPEGLAEVAHVREVVRPRGVPLVEEDLLGHGHARHLDAVDVPGDKTVGGVRESAFGSGLDG